MLASAIYLGAYRLTSERSIGIDCLRAVAILWVMLYHFVPIPLFNRGTHGVLLFFIISGYCISLSASASTSAWDFYAKRLGRLLPALAVTVVVITAAKHLFPELTTAERIPTWFDSAYTLVGMPTLNLLHVNYIRPDGAFWSLEVEFQFYALCALLLAAGLRRYLLAAVCVYCWVRFALSNPKNPYSNDFFAFFIAGLSVAAVLAGFWKQAMFGFATAFLLEVCHLMLGYQQPSVSMEPFRLATLAVGGSAVFVAARFKAPKFLRPVAWIGLISYPLYLIHQDIGRMVLQAMNVGDNTAAELLLRAIALPALLGLYAWIVYVLVERRAIKPVTLLLNSGSTTRRALVPEAAT